MTHGAITSIATPILRHVGQIQNQIWHPPPANGQNQPLHQGAGSLWRRRLLAAREPLRMIGRFDDIDDLEFLNKIRRQRDAR